MAVRKTNKFPARLMPVVRESIPPSCTSIIFLGDGNGSKWATANDSEIFYARRAVRHAKEWEAEYATAGRKDP